MTYTYKRLPLKYPMVRNDLELRNKIPTRYP
jgi:hypothetical protein